MQNNIIIFFFIILNLTILNAHSNDQINFDVSELEILDGGNKIIGKNRGNISTADGINIEADKFEFDKTQNMRLKKNVEVVFFAPHPAFFLPPI